MQELQVYTWLHATDPSDLHERSCDTYEPGTGEWLFRSPSWDSWLKEKTRCLWVHGIPGAGKTIFASHLIETARDYCMDRGSGYACVYYYCYFGHAQDETAPLLRWVLLELCRQIGRVPLAVYNLYRHGGTPNSRALLTALGQVVQAFHRVFVFVEAVDESLHRENLLRILRDLATDQRFMNLRVLATSREVSTPLYLPTYLSPEAHSRRCRQTNHPPHFQYIDIEEVMSSIATPISMRNHLLDRDIAIYIRSKLSTHRRLKRWPDQTRENVFEALSTKANGM